MLYLTQGVNVISEQKKYHNVAFISGRVEKGLEYSHQVYGVNFYRIIVRVKRLSGEEDFIPIIVSESKIGKEIINTPIVSKFVEVSGQFRSYNRLAEDGRHVDLFIFAKDINICENEVETNGNLVYLDGRICKTPIFRKTPQGSQITDFIIAVNIGSGRTVYIPCIAWSTGAKIVNSCKIGSSIELLGRIQSREYFKRYSPDSELGEYRTAYEVSVMKILQA